MTVAESSATDAPLVDVRAVVARYRSRPASDVRAAAGIAAAAAVCLLAAVRIALNAPLGRSPAGLQTAYAAVNAAAVVVPAGAALGLGTVADTDLEAVGLLAAGVFALLALLLPATELAAVGVLPVAAGLVTLPTRATGPRRTAERWAFAGLAVAAVALSLGGTTGLLAADAQSLGTVAAFLAVAAAPAVARSARPALIAGAVAAALVLAGAFAAPFVAGAVLLAVGAAIDPGMLVAALGIGGGVAVAAEGLHRRRIPLLSGGLLLLAAGVPATVPRALAVVLAAHLLVTSGLPERAGSNGGEPS